MYGMAMMSTDDGGSRRRKRMWRSDYITDLIVTAVVKKFPGIVETNCFFLQPPVLSLLNALCIILT
jgi:hypothetical protein